MDTRASSGRGVSSLPGRIFCNRWLRLSAWFLGGLAIAGGISLSLQPRWVDLCSRVDARPGQCSPIDLPTMLGYVLIATGLVVMILGPVANSLYHLFRYGQKWETTRHETAVSNLPLLAGIVYFVLGFVVAATA
ncbi:MAG: hypothetical protein ACE5GC_09395 [Acidimicrobiia bacterium]